ncbi:unnamed protein product [Chrysoparadoxa australica]
MVQFEMDCDRGGGNAAACHSVGDFQCVIKQDYKAAVETFTTNCERFKYPASCFNIGKMIAGGHGTERNDKKMLSYFDVACKGGHMQACHLQGLLLVQGSEGVTKDHSDKVSANPKLARQCWEKACEDSVGESCYLLATQLLRKDRKGPYDRDPVKAKVLLEKACKRNHTSACHNLAVMFRHGDEDVEPDTAQFRKYAALTEELAKQTGGLGGVKVA